jgi:hypothetical protein
MRALHAVLPAVGLSAGTRGPGQHTGVECTRPREWLLPVIVERLSIHDLAAVVLIVLPPQPGVALRQGTPCHHQRHAAGQERPGQPG